MLFLRCNQDRRSSGAAANPPPARERPRSPASGRTAAGGGLRTTSASPGPASASPWCRPSRHPFLSRLRPRPVRSRGADLCRKLLPGLERFHWDGLEQRHGHRAIARRAPSVLRRGRGGHRGAQAVSHDRFGPRLIRLNWLPWNPATFRGFPRRWAAGQEARGLILVANWCARGDGVIAPPRCDWSSRVAPCPTASLAHCLIARFRPSGRSGGKSRSGDVGRQAPVGLNPGAVLELGELPHRARPRVAAGGRAGIGSASVADDLIKGPVQGEVEFAAVRPSRGRDRPRSLRKARGGLWEARVAVHDHLSSRM